MYPNIAYEMTVNQITIPKLAEKIGMPRATLYDKYKGKREFTLDEAQRIKDALHSEMTFEELFKKVNVVKEQEAV